MKYGLFILSLFICLMPLAQDSTTIPMQKEKVTIEIWSDVVCPFCLLGKKKLEQAIEKLDAGDKVDIVWRSFQLDPYFPKIESVPSKKNLVERKGYPSKQVDQMCDNLTLQGKDYGIIFDFYRAVTFNTFDAHRLIQWAKTKRLSNELKGALMVAHFTLGIDLSKEENILAVIEKVGLDKEEAKQILSSDQFTADVNNDIQQAQQLGIRGVPFFLINGKEGISGAQSDRVFENQLNKAISNLPVQSDTLKGGVCTPEGECE
jgi:predicted DsbA family dithiol-disulfide isomerase